MENGRSYSNAVVCKKEMISPEARRNDIFFILLLFLMLRDFELHFVRDGILRQINVAHPAE